MKKNTPSPISRGAQREAALDAANAGTFQYDFASDTTYWDERTYKIFGVDAKTFHNTYDAWLGLLYPDDIQKTEEHFKNNIENSENFELEYRLKDRGRGVRWINIIATISRDENRTPLYINGLAIDITSRKEADAQLRLARQVFNATSEGIVVTDLNGNITDANPAYEQITGYRLDEIKGKNQRIMQSGIHDNLFYDKLWSSIDSVGYWKGEIWDKRKDGVVYPKRLLINQFCDENNKPVGYIGVFDDITLQKENEKKVEFLAYKDTLTALSNRTAFNQQIKKSIALAKRENNQLALLYIDLDQFKDVNDVLGHGQGDQLLTLASQRLESALRESDQIFRVGGDEFTVILTNCDDVVDSSRVAENLLKIISQPFLLDDSEINIGCSIGISLYPKDTEDIDSLVRYADIAMYRAKNEGRNKYRFFTNTMNLNIQKRVETTQALTSAMSNNELRLYYQPQINLQNNQIIGMEALMRWQHPQKGIIPPLDFIPIAEDTGLIIPMGAWSIAEACRQLKAFNNPSLYIALNLSPRQFRDKQLIPTLKSEMIRNNITPHQVEVEVTESMMMDDVKQSITILNQIRSLGIKIAMDDFGTGYSSLSYLKKFPLDILKIDQSFISDLFISNSDTAIIKAIIMMAKSLNMDIVAEGIETEQQRIFLKEQGCDIGQGYLFSHPVPSKEIELIVNGVPLSP